MFIPKLKLLMCNLLRNEIPEWNSEYLLHPRKACMTHCVEHIQHAFDPIVRMLFTVNPW